MRTHAMLLVCLVSALVAATGSESRADTPSDTSSSASAPVAPPPAPTDGFRLRHGIDATFGDEIGSGPSAGLTGALGGIDWRFGAQINNSWAVYLDTHLSLGTASIGMASGVTGNFAAAVMGEYTLFDHFFAAVGGGYGVLNNPSGPLLQVRGGWYPLESKSRDSARRRGLMIGFDVREYFAGPNVGTVSQLSLAIGYEKF